MKYLTIIGWLFITTLTCIVGRPDCSKVACKLDFDCIRPSHCCSACPEPIATEHSGTCPRPKGRGICVSLCKTDSDCTVDKKCCSNGCGQVCKSPEGGVTGCRYNGKYYSEGESIPDSGPCRLCTCRSGQVQCFDLPCRPPNDVPP